MSTFNFSIRRRDLAWAVALVVLLSAIWVAKSDVADAGGSPPGTGIAVVYIAVGTNFPDALGVGPGAGLNGAPIILVPTNPPLDGATITELERLDPRTVIIIGGTSAVSQATEDAIVALLPNADVSRIAGTNRYRTNAAFSAATFPIEEWASVPAVAFTGDNPETDDVNIRDYFAYNVTDGELRAPIQLPDGAEVLELRALAYDTAEGLFQWATVYLQRNSTTTGVSDVIAWTSTSGDDGLEVISTTAIVAGSEIVDNEAYAYLVYVTGIFTNPYLVNVSVRYRLGAPTG